MPALDPEQACRQVLDAGLVVHRAHPLNCETPLAALRTAAEAVRAKQADVASL